MDDSNSDIVERDKGGKFVAGKSGNPAGRPKGSKNRVTILKVMAEQAVREENIDNMLDVARLVIAQAMEGDTRSQKLVWEAIMSKGTTDDKSQAKEKVEINIGGMPAQEVETVTVIENPPQVEDTNDE